MSYSDPNYQAFLAALGNLCIHWAWLDRELNFLIAEALQIDDQKQSASILTEMMDVAPRCRTMKRLAFTVGASKEWRTDLIDLMNIIENRLAPLRNRYVHDHWSETGARMVKLDRRARIVKPQAFQDEELLHDIAEEIGVDAVDDLAVAVIIALTNVAQARLDLGGRRKGLFPECALLDLASLRQQLQALRPAPQSTPPQQR